MENNTYTPFKLILLWLTFSTSHSRSRKLVLVDGFSEYLSGNCRSYCKANNIEVIELLSPYMHTLCKSRGVEIPENSRAPTNDDAIFEWANNVKLFDTNEKDDKPIVYVISESDSGVSTAEKIAATLNLVGNGLSPHLRNKYLSNLKAIENGIETLQQCLANTESEAIDFINSLWSNNNNNKCVVKPYR
jgi:hypothetical protein